MLRGLTPALGPEGNRARPGLLPVAGGGGWGAKRGFTYSKIQYTTPAASILYSSSLCISKVTYEYYNTVLYCTEYARSKRTYRTQGLPPH